MTASYIWLQVQKNHQCPHEQAYTSVKDACQQYFGFGFVEAGSEPKIFYVLPGRWLSQESPSPSFMVPDRESNRGFT
jgi:hypothetical protein